MEHFEDSEKELYVSQKVHTVNSTHEDRLKEEKIDSIQNGSAYAEEESSSKIMEKTRSSKI